MSARDTMIIFVFCEVMAYMNPDFCVYLILWGHRAHA